MEDKVRDEQEGLDAAWNDGEAVETAEQEVEKQKGGELKKSEEKESSSVESEQAPKGHGTPAESGDTAYRETSERQRKEDFAAFVRAYPQVKATDIPREVWDAVRSGESLTSAYGRFETRTLREENKGLRERLAALEQSERNKERSAGSQRSAGRATESQSWENVWYSDD